MKTTIILSGLGWLFSALGALTIAATVAPPVVKTVPWLANNPLVPHTTYNTKVITLKGTCDRAGANLQWTWDFGDGSPVATGTVSDNYAVQATHAYSAADGTVFTARLTILDTSTNETGTAPYYIEVQPKSLEVEANLAIDEGLWYLHKVQTRSDSGGIEYGHWSSSKLGGYANYSYSSLAASNLGAFEVNGHSATGLASNPYSETVRRGMNTLLTRLKTVQIGLQTIQSVPPLSVNPDTPINEVRNGYGILVNDGYEFYQGGMIMDAIVASGTPNAVAQTGINPGVLGRTYKDIVQDMVDAYCWAQYDANPGGGWRYSANEYPDNSACQWAAIGMIAAERGWGLTVPQWVKDWNLVWLRNSQHPSGYFGYTGYDGPWGVFATTPSGMVQMALDGVSRDDSGTPSWNAAETYIRDRFGNTGGATNAIKDYYYGLFSFVKSMLLHPDGPITMLRSQTPGVLPIDWYAAEVAKGDPTDGVARTLIGDQAAAGYWYGHNYNGSQYFYETAWAIMMLHRTIFEQGRPVAVAAANPNPGIAGQNITLDGSESYHQDPNRKIVGWSWDVDSDGVFDTSGPTVTISVPAVGNYPVKLRITDDNTPPKTADTILTVIIATPPVAPTANAGGPYVFCPAAKPWFLNGFGSVNPDEGGHQFGFPGDTIQEYAWDLDGDRDFNDAFGPTPDVTSYFTQKGPGNYLVQLRVTDTTSVSYPSSNLPDQTDTDKGQIVVFGENAGECACITISAEPLVKKIGVVWDLFVAADHFNVYRSVIAGGPYTLIGTVNGSDPTIYFDSPGVLNQVYYYVVRPALANGNEICQSNQVSAEPLHPIPTVACTPNKMSNLAKYYYKLTAASECFGRNQLRIYVGDTDPGSTQVAGPFSTEKVVYIRTGVAAPSIRAGTTGIEAYIMTKGRAKVWAVDPIGQSSLILLVP